MDVRSRPNQDAQGLEGEGNQMKPGDLVRHPKGMKNVCPKRYAAGLVLEVHHPTNPPGMMPHVLVLWHTLEATNRYHIDQLEVISEAR